ncbi:lasso peptide biosynthesis B2 protein [Roseateles sp. LYH14W]|uniref:Lasso peptide biosynthesis B2 protein n=1 Tax=Pelomonas parva TaxID=3299032 RepID=A0ABW7F8H2_9BURK
MTTTSPIQPRYRLADHVRACHVDGQVILLDLQRGKYIGMGGPLLAELSSQILGWPTASTASTGRTPDDEVHRGISELRRQHLLVAGSSAPLAEIDIASPLETLAESGEALASERRWRGLASIACSSFVAARWLKRDSLATIASNVSQLRPSQIGTAASCPSADLRRAVSSYHRLRPLIMTSQDKCLHDSLTLVRFLATRSLYPRWVIGVRTRPFAAHSWVQAGSTVLNDLHERVRGFTPILVV